MSDRNFFKAYIQLQQVHRDLHKVLKAMEDDRHLEDILKQFYQVEELLVQVKGRLRQEDRHV
jgi:metal-dependent HD superfamily phosphatase/phosphodiesterase